MHFVDIDNICPPLEPRLSYTDYLILGNLLHYIISTPYVEDIEPWD